MERRTVEDVMTTEVVTVTEDTPFIEIVETLADHCIGAVPVLSGDGRVTGIVTEADLLHKQYKSDPPDTEPRLDRLRHRRARAKVHAKADAVDARGLMTSPAVTIAPRTPVAEAARLLVSRGFKRAPVVDDGGRLKGIVARRDLLSVFQRSDDAIRGEIIREVLVCRLWQDPSEIKVRVEEGVVHLHGKMELKSLIPVVVRMTAATEGVVDVVAELDYDHDDTHPTAYPRA
ncbi:CBS domain-containing protein [Actinomadura macra]|uniref:CBS domain-containing protein n=1 Tax=Actinomadura macra TaxID=46164 RepID=UPI00082AE39C|nr:CBS domain-containing protein [Actinomadura macra]